jgi:hypothetical protein
VQEMSMHNYRIPSVKLSVVDEESTEERKVLYLMKILTRKKQRRRPSKKNTRGEKHIK